MAITYNAGTNTITVTGYTEATPCNFTDIYNADVAGSWGQVTRQCTHQFCFDAKLVIGDGSTTTWFADTKKHVTFTAGVITASWQTVFRATNNAHIRLGVHYSGYDTRDGCSIITLHTASNQRFIEGLSGATIEIYSSQLIGMTLSRSIYIHPYPPNNESDFKIYNTLLLSVTLAGEVTAYNVTSEYARVGFANVSGNINKVICSQTTLIGYQVEGTDDATLKNFIVSGIVSGHAIRTQTTTKNQYFVNPDFSAWTIDWAGASHPTIYRQYEFDLKVADKDNVAINGATVKIWDKDSSLVVDTTTNASGVIATQTITRGYYNQANGNTLQEASPHLIKITKAGYTMYEADFVLEDKTGWLIALQTSILRNPPMTGGMV